MSLNIDLEIANVSDVGQRRPHNEDSTASVLTRGIVIVADGMGGYKAGEVASAIATTTVVHDISQGLSKLKSAKNDKSANSEYSSLVKSAIIHANSIIYTAAQKDEQCQGMGTTIVTGLFYEDKIVVGHVGDSRVYRLRDGDFHQVTKDHSLIQEVIDRGLYTPEEAAANTPKNLVTRALGIDAKVDVDIIEQQVKIGDIYILCSDGLTDMVKDEEIHLTLSKYSANLVQAADNLVQQANSKGGKDNISVILAHVSDVKNNSNGRFHNLFSRFF